jgi:hypothetical protein
MLSYQLVVYYISCHGCACAIVCYIPCHGCQTACAIVCSAPLIITLLTSHGPMQGPNAA